MTCNNLAKDVNVNKSFSTDNFSIRPKKFKIEKISSIIYAGKDFSITLKSLDNNNKNIINYNEKNGTSFKVDAKEILNKCITGNFVGNFNFKNGISTTKVNYDEVGKINIQIGDNNIPCNKRFASVDCKDTNVKNYWNSDINTSISNDNTKIVVIPDHFQIDTNLTNFNNGSFTYLSKDLNMSAVLNINITVKNYKNKITKNYNENCYSKDTNYNISYKNINNSLTQILYQDNNTSIKNKINLNQSIILHERKNFFIDGNNNGSAKIKLL